MSNVREILKFSVNLAKEMLICGANLERVNFTVEKICHAYGLVDVVLDSMTTRIHLNARDKNGEEAEAHAVIKETTLNLDKLAKLNKLSYRVCEQKPPAVRLKTMLKKAQDEKDPLWFLVWAGYLIAMCCLCRIFGGVWQDLIVVLVNTTIFFFMSLGLKKFKLDSTLNNFIMMFVVTSVSLLFAYIGFIEQLHLFFVIITAAFYLIPGIPMVNAIRNLLCGNEMNGIVEFLKVILSIIAIALGLGASFFVFASSGWITVDITESMIPASNSFINQVELVVISFLASYGFGICFKIKGYKLLFAGLAGALIRIVYLLMLAVVPEYRIIYTSVAAFTAAIYAEILARIRKEPSTLYLYPAIVPLIPGDLFYYACLGIVWSNTHSELFMNNAPQCLLQLVAMSIGFILFSAFLSNIRQFNLHNLIKKRQKEVK